MRRTYGHNVQEHAEHVVAVALVHVHVAVVVQVRRVPGRVVHLEVVVVPELVVGRDRGRHALFGLQTGVRGVQEGRWGRGDLDLERLVSGVDARAGSSGRRRGM